MKKGLKTVQNSYFWNTCFRSLTQKHKYALKGRKIRTLKKHFVPFYVRICLELLNSILNNQEYDLTIFLSKK